MQLSESKHKNLRCFRETFSKQRKKNNPSTSKYQQKKLSKLFLCIKSRSEYQTFKSSHNNFPSLDIRMVTDSNLTLLFLPSRYRNPWQYKNQHREKTLSKFNSYIHTHTQKNRITCGAGFLLFLIHTTYDFTWRLLFYSTILYYYHIICLIYYYIMVIILYILFIIILCKPHVKSYGIY